MTQVDELVASGRSAMDAGNPLVARGYLRRAARLAPDRLDIWLNLCKVTESSKDRLKCLERIVALDPTNAEAQAELAQLRSREASLTEAAIQPAEASEPQEADPSLTMAAPPVEGEGAAEVAVTEEMRRAWDEAVAAGRPLTCLNHPQQETSLRCNRCGAPICSQCAVRTPVGFRCKTCVRAQQAIFYTARWYDYPLAALVALLLSVPAAVVAGIAGWWFALILSPIAGGLIGGVVHRAVGRRRGRGIWLLVAACIVLGALAALIVQPGGILPLGIHAVIAAGAAIGVLRLGRRL